MCTTLRHTTVFPYSHAKTPLSQSERAYYLSYFLKNYYALTVFPNFHAFKGPCFDSCLNSSKSACTSSLQQYQKLLLLTIFTGYEKSLKIFWRSNKDPVKILIFKDLCQVFEDLWGSLRILWGFSPEIPCIWYECDTYTCWESNLYDKFLTQGMYTALFMFACLRANRVWIPH